MRKLAVAAVLLASTSALAQQPPSYSFTMTPDEANLMFEQLGKRDWVTINPLIQKLITQLQAQTKPPVLPPAPVPPKE